MQAEPIEPIPQETQAPGNGGGEEQPQETEVEQGTETSSEPVIIQETEALPDTEEIPEIGLEGETSDSPLGEIKAYRILHYRTKPYKGEGTKEKTLCFFL